MKSITLNNSDALLRGASLLACGGGLSFTEQRRLMKKPVLAKALRVGIRLLSPDELADDAVCATLSEVGASDAPVMDKALLPQAKALLEQKTGNKITALIPGEIGQESILLEAAAILNLPVVDADLAGCRAVPRLTDSALVVQGVPFTMSPMVILNDEGEARFIKQQSSLQDDEQQVRALVKPKKVVTLLGGLVTGKTIKEFLDYRSYSVAIKLGKALVQSKNLPSILPTACLLPPTVATVRKVKKIASQGFDQKLAFLQTKSGDTVGLEIENEYMKLTKPGGEFAFPQLIMAYSPELQRGLHSSEIVTGKTVTVLVADMFDFWKGKKS